MADKQVSIIIRAKDATKRAIQSIGVSFKNLGKGIASRIGGALKSLVSFQGGLLSVGTALAGFGASMKKAFEFERYTMQFKVLFGNMDEAKARMRDLREFVAKNPVQMDEAAKASRQLEVFTGGVMGAVDSLKLVGDAATATGQPINDVAFWVGRAYDAISNGRPFGEAAMRLQEMGILSGEARGKIEQLSKAGASSAAIWEVVQQQLEKSKGGMDELSTTGEGLISNLKSEWITNLTLFGEQFVDLSKNKISGLIEKLQDLRNDGSISIWASRVKTALGGVGTALSGVGKAFGWVADKIKTAAQFYGSASTKGLFGSTAEIGREMLSLDAKDAEDEARLREEAQKKAAARVKQTEKSLAERITEDIAKKEKAAKTDAIETAAKKEQDDIVKRAAERADALAGVIADASALEGELAAEALEERKAAEIEAVKEVAAVREKLMPPAPAALDMGRFAGESVTAETLGKYSPRQISLASRLDADRVERLVAAIRGDGDNTQTRMLEKIANSSERTAAAIEGGTLGLGR